MDKNTTYLLDTSAIISLPKVTLEKCKQLGVRLEISPISIWELLCHLDEREQEYSNWARSRGPLLRTRFCSVLNDPFVEHTIFCDVEQIANPTRFYDLVMINNLLGELEDSESLDDFYSRTVNYPDGKIGLIQDCSIRVRALLDREEKKYTESLKERREMILKLMDKENGEMRESPLVLDQISDDDYLAATAFGGVQKLWESYRKFSKDDDATLRYKLFLSLYPYFGYIFERTLYYMEKEIRHGEAPIDENDAEDSYIMLHLNLVENKVFVTGDNGAKDALRNSLERLAEILDNKDMDIDILTGVLKNEEFSVLVEDFE